MRKLIFFGELPPFSINGISISNEINLKILSDYFELIIICESRNLDRRGKLYGVHKIFASLKDLSRFLVQVVGCRPHMFYTVMPASYLGFIKVAILILIFKIFSFGSVIIHIHRGDFLEFSCGGFWGRFIRKFINFFVLKIIVLSDSQRLSMLHTGYKGVDFLANSINKIAQRNEQIESSNLICISNYVPGKGQFILLDALKILNDERCFGKMHFYGAGNFDKYKLYAEDIELSSVYFNGPILENDKFEALSKAKILILPSLNEGQPLVIIEAMSVGTIVVATNVGLVSEMLGDDYPYLCEAGDSVSLAVAIKLALDSKNKEETSLRLIERYNKLFSPQVHREKIIKIFSLD